jgi:hypothetical protein
LFHFFIGLSTEHPNQLIREGNMIFEFVSFKD